ncbi:MAG: isoprenylcysteine carboxylmethyltransferase family protein [Alphaproteobacteria bacterium]|nr:isoprenylcysteine carboxylmethyltransferase family protein [Alphaproteobacteria bacterium]MCB9930543.1 isoprenylcysteine carboxylmethyltransferase family protein [Alphaproteobacteria bacterium]
MVMGMLDIWKRDPDSPDIVALPPVIHAVGFLAGYACNIWWGWSFGVGRALGIGWLLVAAAGLLAVWAAWCFRRAGTNIPPHQPATALVTDGPYRATRNPMYVALAVAQIGLAGVLDAPAVLLALVVIVPLMHWGVVLREEAYMEAKFGEAYRAYKQATKRYV